MRIFRLLLWIICLSVILPSCYKCIECTANQEDFGDVTREVCGRKKARDILINELETDTIGTGPWLCDD